MSSEGLCIKRAVIDNGTVSKSGIATMNWEIERADWLIGLTQSCRFSTKNTSTSKKESSLK